MSLGPTFIGADRERLAPRSRTPMLIKHLFRRLHTNAGRGESELLGPGGARMRVTWKQKAMNRSTTPRNLRGHTAAIVVASALCFAGPVAQAQNAEIARALNRGALFGLGMGIASALAYTLKPTKVEAMAEAGNAGGGAQRRTYGRPGVQVIVASLGASKAVVPIRVELTSLPMIRTFAKTLSETPRSAVVANFGTPEQQSPSSIRYRGPSEACDESLEMTFHGNTLESLKWSFCSD